MGYFMKMAATVFLLIGIYLFLNNPSATAKIIDSFSNNAISGIKVLQGR